MFWQPPLPEGREVDQDVFWKGTRFEYRGKWIEYGHKGVLLGPGGEKGGKRYDYCVQFEGAEHRILKVNANKLSDEPVQICFPPLAPSLPPSNLFCPHIHSRRCRTGSPRTARSASAVRVGGAWFFFSGWGQCFF